MFNDLFAQFKSEYALDSVAAVCESLEDLLDCFEQELLKDGNSRASAIDATIEILKQYRDELPSPSCMNECNKQG